jgi:hypothetical protein
MHGLRHERRAIIWNAGNGRSGRIEDILLQFHASGSLNNYILLHDHPSWVTNDSRRDGRKSTERSVTLRDK